MGQETALVESELSPNGKSDLKPCSDPGSIFSLDRISQQKLDANPGLGLQNPAFCPSCLPPLWPLCACVALGIKDI